MAPQGKASRGLAWQGRQGVSRRGMARSVRVRLGRHGPVRLVGARQGIARWGLAGVARRAMARHGLVRRGVVWQVGMARHRWFRQGSFGPGMAGEARPGWDRHGMALARQGGAGMDGCVMDRRGVAGPGTAVKAHKRFRPGGRTPGRETKHNQERG